MSGRAEVTLQHETQKEETEHFLGADVRELIIDTYTGKLHLGTALRHVLSCLLKLY